MKVEEKCDLRRASYMKMLLITRGLLGNMFFSRKIFKVCRYMENDGMSNCV